MSVHSGGSSEMLRPQSSHAEPRRREAAAVLVPPSELIEDRAELGSVQNTRGWSDPGRLRGPHQGFGFCSASCLLDLKSLRKKLTVVTTNPAISNTTSAIRAPAGIPREYVNQYSIPRTRAISNAIQYTLRLDDGRFSAMVIPTIRFFIVMMIAVLRTSCRLAQPV